MTKEEKRRWYAEQEERERQGLPTEKIDVSDYNPFSNPFSGEGIGNLTALGEGIKDWWDHFRNGDTNDVAAETAKDNLDYERERAAVEDTRYLDETSYNRAWAEDERAYNRALQQTIFDREDTAIQRQANQLSQMGINPLTQQMSGLDAGQAVSSAVAPSASTRTAIAPHNEFQKKDTGILSAIAPLASLANTINQVATGQGQRDLLLAQRDKQILENAVLAHDYGLFVGGKGKNRFAYQSYINDNDYGWNRSTGWKNDFNYGQSFSGFYNGMNAEREYKYKNANNIFDSQPSWAKNMNYLLSDSFFNTAEKALTKGSKLFDNVLDGKGINPFKKLLDFFW